jgi:hypothetical protein
MGAELNGYGATAKSGSVHQGRTQARQRETGRRLQQWVPSSTRWSVVTGNHLFESQKLIMKWDYLTTIGSMTQSTTQQRKRRTSEQKSFQLQSVLRTRTIRNK